MPLSVVGADFSPVAAAARLTDALSFAHLTLTAWFAARPPDLRIPAPTAPELRYAPGCQLRYLDGAGFAIVSADERTLEHHPYWLLDAEDVLTCLHVLAEATSESNA